MSEDKAGNSRRSFLSLFLMMLGLAASFGTLLVQALIYLIPGQSKAKKRKVFAGNASHFSEGGVKVFYDLTGNEILIRKDDTGYHAFNSTCPHLGCKVHWEEDEKRFFCPCHNGAFDKDGKAIAGPPADSGMALATVDLDVDEGSGVVYIMVDEPKQ